jgi:hypothetical protein
MLLDIPFISVPSNNHASPSGALPFLIPASSSNQTSPPVPIPSHKLLKWSSEEANLPSPPTGLRYDAYQSLLDVQIRRAWVRSSFPQCTPSSSLPSARLIPYTALQPLPAPPALPRRRSTAIHPPVQHEPLHPALPRTRSPTRRHHRAPPLIARLPPACHQHHHIALRRRHHRRRSHLPRRRARLGRAQHGARR